MRKKGKKVYLYKKDGDNGELTLQIEWKSITEAAESLSMTRTTLSRRLTEEYIVELVNTKDAKDKLIVTKFTQDTLQPKKKSIPKEDKKGFLVRIFSWLFQNKNK